MTVLLDAPIDVSSLDFTRFDGYFDAYGVIFYKGESEQEETIPLRPVRQDVGNNPDEIRPETGDMFAQSDFSGGMGQEKFHSPSSDKSRYFYSQGFDISNRGELRHHHPLVKDANIAEVRDMVLGDGKVFIVETTAVKRTTSFPATWTTEDTSDGESGAGNGPDNLASAGTIMYVARDVGGIHDRSSAGVWNHYSDVTATLVEWLKDRLIGFSSETRDLYEVTAAGAAPSPIETLQEGWAIYSLWEAGPYIYAACVNGQTNESKINFYGLNSDATALEKKGHTPMPRGDVITGGAGYLSTMVLVGGRSLGNGNYTTVLYQAFPNESGFLQYLKVLDTEGVGISGLGRAMAVEPLGNSVAATWFDIESFGVGFSGIVEHDLSRDAVSLRVPVETASESVHNIVKFNNILLVGTTDGLYYENRAKYVDEATLITSQADWNNAGLKTIRSIEWMTDPLPAGTSIDVYYSTQHPDEEDWILAGTQNTGSSEGQRVDLSDVSGRQVALKFVSHASSDGTVAPVIKGFSVRSDPLPSETEWRLTRFLRIRENDRATESAQAVLRDVRESIDTIRELAYQWTTFYEPGVQWNVRVESVARIEPQQPVYSVTGGEKRKERNVMRVVMQGTKSP